MPAYFKKAVLLVFSLYAYASADVLQLTNGGTLEGIIVQETDTAVTLKVSVGKMVVFKAEITGSMRSGKKANADLERQWAKERARQSKLKATEKSRPALKLKGGAVNYFKVTIRDDLVRKSNIPAEKVGGIPARAMIGIYCPAGFSMSKTYPLLIAMEPGEGNGLAALKTYYQCGNDVGLIVAASQVQPQEDNKEARYYYTLHIIEFLRENRV